jgi:hypothetical protein
LPNKAAKGAVRDSFDGKAKSDGLLEKKWIGREIGFKSLGV